MHPPAAAAEGRPRGKNIERAFGLGGAELPAVALESQPGDAVVFIQTLKHAAYGGRSRRRMFTINCTLACTCRHFLDLCVLLPVLIDGGHARCALTRTIVSPPSDNGAAEEAVLRSELENTHAAAYRTDVYEGAMLETAGPGRRVHLAAVGPPPPSVRDDRRGEGGGE
eukprot:SAG22_NODE_1677_length_3828_cov_2.539019_5_plen_167_part_01